MAARRCCEQCARHDKLIKVKQTCPTTLGAYHGPVGSLGGDEITVEVGCHRWGRLWRPKLEEMAVFRCYLCGRDEKRKPMSITESRGSGNNKRSGARCSMEAWPRQGGLRWSRQAAAMETPPMAISNEQRRREEVKEVRKDHAMLAMRAIERW